jgi:hypothetical protein
MFLKKLASTNVPVNDIGNAHASWEDFKKPSTVIIEPMTKLLLGAGALGGALLNPSSPVGGAISGAGTAGGYVGGKKLGKYLADKLIAANVFKNLSDSDAKKLKFGMGLGGSILSAIAMHKLLSPNTSRE